MTKLWKKEEMQYMDEFEITLEQLNKRSTKNVCNREALFYLKENATTHLVDLLKI